MKLIAPFYADAPLLTNQKGFVMKAIINKQGDFRHGLFVDVVKFLPNDISQIEVEMQILNVHFEYLDFDFEEVKQQTTPTPPTVRTVQTVDCITFLKRSNDRVST